MYLVVTQINETSQSEIILFCWTFLQNNRLYDVNVRPEPEQLMHYIRISALFPLPFRLICMHADRRHTA